MTLRQKTEIEARRAASAVAVVRAPVAVVRLGRESTIDAAEVGGKAEMLDQLARWGLPVPPACVVPTRSYRGWLEAGLATSLRELGRRVGEGAPIRGLLSAVAADDDASAAADA